jgi:GH35 family endo-1,4-beta-xylanase
MKNLKVYLDTSIINFLRADDAPVYKNATEILFHDVIVPNRIDTYISRILLEEIDATTNDKTKKELQGLVNKYKEHFKMLEADNEEIDEITFLAGEYIKEKIIPEKKISDAFHVAYSTIFEMDILLSWNFKHLANINKEQRILIVNKTHGYNYPFRLANPLEVQYDE